LFFEAKFSAFLWGVRASPFGGQAAPKFCRSQAWLWGGRGAGVMIPFCQGIFKLELALC